MTFAYYDIDGGATLHEHSHPNEEVWHIIEGDVDLTVGDETWRVGAGNAVVVPPETTHAVSVANYCRAIVVDYPVRHDVAGIKI
jgi:quercetin dioxygenase-like cupin family protein